MSTDTNPQISPPVLIKLAGVPEQVNLPIAICAERTIFERYGIVVEFVVVPEGTGAMLAKLENGEVDIALTVTDALIVGASSGRKVQLVGTFVSSPLVWAVAAGGSESPSSSSSLPITGLDALMAKDQIKFGVSRLGSGSHTMAQYACATHGRSLDGVSFVACNDIKGLTDAARKGGCDAFLWETFTTKPLFDSGELRQLGDVPTPWTSFSFAAPAAGVLSPEKEAAIRDKLFPALAEGCELFCAESSASAARIKREFGHKEEDAAAWLSRVQYNTAQAMQADLAHTEASTALLRDIGLVRRDFTAEDLWRGSAIRRPYAAASP